MKNLLKFLSDMIPKTFQLFGFSTLKLQKLLTIFVTTCFLVSSVGRDIVTAATKPTMNAQEYKQIFSDFMLPYSYGKISGSHFAGTDRVVINIQDLHCHPQVQKSISGIIETFDNKYGVSNVYLEGAYGDVSTRWLTESSAYKNNKEKLLEKMLNTGKLTGAEYFSATSNKTEIIKGLEKKEPYLDNLKRFGNLIEKQPEIQIFLEGIEESTAKVKKQYYTRRQYKIEELSKQYIEGKISAEKYYALMAKHTQRLGINLTKYENTFLYMQLLALQSELNYGAITTQLQTMVLLLKENLPPNAYQILLNNTKNFEQTDKLYAYIIKLSKSFGLDLSVNFKELNKYFTFIELSQRINPLELLKEEELLTREINTRFSETVAQREVVFLTNFEKYLRDYLSTKITADDYEYFKQNIETYKKLYNKYVDDKTLSLLEPYMAETEKFYQINTNRNEYFTENIFNGTETGKIENIKKEHDEINKIIENMDKAKRIDVIITGGFHSQTVSEILKQHEISYIVITPNVEGGVAEAEKTYYEIAKQQKEINFQTLAPIVASLNPAEQKELLGFNFKEGTSEEDIQKELENSKFIKELAQKLQSDDISVDSLFTLAQELLGEKADNGNIKELVGYMVLVITNEEENKSLSKFINLFKTDKLANEKREAKKILQTSYFRNFIREADNKFKYTTNAIAETDIYYIKDDGQQVFLKDFSEQKQIEATKKQKEQEKRTKIITGKESMEDISKEYKELSNSQEENLSFTQQLRKDGFIKQPSFTQQVRGDGTIVQETKIKEEQESQTGKIDGTKTFKEVRAELREKIDTLKRANEREKEELKSLLNLAQGIEDFNEIETKIEEKQENEKELIQKEETKKQKKGLLDMINLSKGVAALTTLFSMIFTVFVPTWKLQDEEEIQRDEEKKPEEERQQEPIKFNDQIKLLTKVLNPAGTLTQISIDFVGEEKIDGKNLMLNNSDNENFKEEDINEARENNITCVSYEIKSEPVSSEKKSDILKQRDEEKAHIRIEYKDGKLIISSKDGIDDLTPEMAEELIKQIFKGGLKTKSKIFENVEYLAIATGKEKSSADIINRMNNEKMSSSVTPPMESIYRFKDDEIKDTNTISGIMKTGFNTLEMSKDNYNDYGRTNKEDCKFIVRETDVNEIEESFNDIGDNQSGITFDFSNKKSIENPKEILNMINEQKRKSKKATNLNIYVKFNSDDYAKLKGINIFEQYGIIPIADESSISDVDGKKMLDTENMNSLENIEHIKTKNDIFGLIFDEDSVTKLGAVIGGIKTVIEYFANDIITYSPQEKFKNGLRKALKSNSLQKADGSKYDCTIKDLSNIKLLEDLLKADITTDNIEEQINKLKLDNLFEDDAKNYIKQLIEEENYIEALGFIRGVVMNTVAKEIPVEDIKDIVINNTEDNEIQGILIWTIQNILKGKTIEELYNTNTKDVETRNAEDVLEEMRLKSVNTFTKNEYKITTENIADIYDMPFLLMSDYGKKGVVKEIKIPANMIKAMLAAA